MREEGHDGYCGPNNRLPCPECLDEVLDSDDPEDVHYLLRYAMYSMSVND